MANAEFVKCRYKHCDKLHSDTKVRKEDAVQGGVNFYYHPDCLHTKKTIEEIRDLFIKYIDSTLNAKQVGMLVKVINDIVFIKKVDVDYLKYCLGYYIKYKPGVLKYPGGLHYIFNQKEVKEAWNKYQNYKIKEKLKASKQNRTDTDVTSIDFSQTSFTYTPSKQKSFEDILG